MIRSQAQYRGTAQRIGEIEQQLAAVEAQLQAEGESTNAIKRLTDDVQTLLSGLRDERDLYERECNEGPTNVPTPDLEPGPITAEQYGTRNDNKQR
jgi:hypothetical protein